MKYEKCVSCIHLGIDCDGPNFIAMEGKGLMEWCKRRKNYLGLSNKDLAERTAVPIGTIDRLFAGNYENFRYSTVRPILQVLVGNEWGDHPCVEPGKGTDAILESICNLHDKHTEHNKLFELALQAETKQGKINRLLAAFCCINTAALLYIIFTM